MADEPWAPKTKEEFTGLMADAFKQGLNAFRSEAEEAEAKGKNGGSDTDDDKEKKNDSGGTASKSFVDRLLGI